MCDSKKKKDLTEIHRDAIAAEESVYRKIKCTEIIARLLEVRESELP